VVVGCSLHVHAVYNPLVSELTQIITVVKVATKFQRMLVVAGTATVDYRTAQGY